tara:strand:+ start:813 stop:1046 length:234 start_codon:yes stop_codon:yes gene_type:complete
MNLFDICMQVLCEASESDFNLESETAREHIANEIYEMHYENSQLVAQNVPNSGYFIDVKDYYSDEMSYTKFVKSDED